MKRLKDLGRILTKPEQRIINGGIEKCCITRGMVGFSENDKECNDNPDCCKSKCACSTNKC